MKATKRKPMIKKRKPRIFLTRHDHLFEIIRGSAPKNNGVSFWKCKFCPETVQSS